MRRGIRRGRARWYARVNGGSRRTLPETVERAEIGGYRHDGHEQGKENEFVEDGAVVVSRVSQLHARILTAARPPAVPWPSCLWIPRWTLSVVWCITAMSRLQVVDAAVVSSPRSQRRHPHLHFHLT